MLKTRKVIIISLFILLFTQLSILANADAGITFSDMPNDWSTSSLEKAISNGLLKGIDGKIMPTAYLNRAQMATVIGRAFGATDKVSLTSYRDVSSNDWFYDDMAKAVHMKTFVGNGDNLEPNKNISREEAFVVLARAFKLSNASEGVLDKFSDKNLISTWAKDGIASLVEEGYIAGSGGSINPKDNITRAEFAQLMDNLIQNYIVNAGTYTNDYNGNVIINTPNVILDNITINGDLIIGDGVGNGDVTLEGVTVTGRTLIRGGGINSIKIVGNSNLNNIIIARVNGQIRVYSENGTEMGQVIVDGSDDVIIEGIAENITVMSPNITVIATNAEIGTAKIEGQNSKIIVEANSNVNSIVLSSKNSKVEVAGTVSNIQTTNEAQNTSISTIAGSNISNIMINGSETNVEGSGHISYVFANADNAVITTPNTIVKAGKEASGVIAGGTTINSGSNVTTNNSGTGIISSGGSSGGSSKIQLTVAGTLLTTTKKYDGNNSAMIQVGTLSGLIADDNVTVSAVATYDSAEAGTNKIITVLYSISGEDADKYIKPDYYTINTGVITPIQLTTSHPALVSIKPYDGNTSVYVETGILTGVVEGDIVTLNANATYDDKNVGTDKTITVIYTISGTDSNNYIKPVNYTVNTGEITAIQLTITDPLLTSTKPYDGNISALVETGILTGVVEGEIVTISAVANYDNKNAGIDKTITVTYTLSGTDSNNYIIPTNYTVNTGEIEAIQLTITDPVLTSTKSYDGNTSTVVVAGNLIGVVVGENVTVSAVANYDTEEIGTNKPIIIVYSLNGEDVLNYIKPINNTANTGSITKKQLTISNPVLTLTKPYDGNTTTSAETGNLIGVVDGDNVIVSAVATYDSAEADINKIITVVYSISGEDADKYISPVDYITNGGEIISIQLTISPLSIILDKQYDGNTTCPQISPSNIGDLLGIISGEDVTVSAIGNYVSKNAGSNTIIITYTLGGADADNYKKPIDANLPGIILQAPLSISNPVLTATKVYDGGTIATATPGTLAGVIPSDDLTVQAIANYDTKNVGTNKQITVSYTLSGVDAMNYFVPMNYIVDTGVINPIQLTISEPILTPTKPYDGNTVATVEAGTINEIIEGDKVIVSAAANYDTVEIGTSKTITVVYSLSGADAVNYIKPVNNTINTGSITKKQLTITDPVLTLSKPYDENTTAEVVAGNLKGVVAEDDITVSAVAYYDSNDVGTNKRITVEYLILGTDADKYIKPVDYVVYNGSIMILEQSAPTGLTGVSPTSSANNDGKLTGVNNEMEYKLSTDTEWTAVTGTEVIDLVPGTYNVRYGAKIGYKAGASAEVTVPEYIETLISKSILDLDYATIYQYEPARLKSKVMTSSNFLSPNEQLFTIKDRNDVVVTVDLWWDIPNTDFAPAGAICGAINSSVQMRFQELYGMDGFNLLSTAAWQDGNTFNLVTTESGPDAYIELGEGWSYFFDTNIAHGKGNDTSANATFTISDGENTATILLNKKYSSITSLVTSINTQISNASVNAVASVNGTDKFILTGNNITIGGADKEIFFIIFESE